MGQLKIAIICENYPPDTGGIAVSARRLSLALSKSMKIHVVHFQNGNPDKPDSHLIITESDNLTVHVLSPFVNGWTIPPDPNTRAKVLRHTTDKLATIFNYEHIDIIHGFGIQNAGLVAARLSHLLDLTLIQSVRGNDVGRNAFDGARRIPLSLALSKADKIVAVNQWIAELIKTNFSWTKPHIRVINNGIAPFIFFDDTLRKRMTFSPRLPIKSPVIGFVGTLREKKNPYLLERLVKDFIRIHEGRLLIIGDVNLEIYKELGWSEGILDNRFVIVRRASDRMELLNMISLCDWLVFPSLDDGMANGLLEALASARPVICSPVFSDIIRNGQNGFIASPFRPSEYVAICKMLWENPDIRNKIGKAARQHIEKNVNSDIECDAWTNLYHETIKQNKVIRL